MDAKVKTWEQFKDAVAKAQDTHRNRFYFRGQDNAKDNLQTTFHRRKSEYDISEYYSKAVKEAHFYISGLLNHDFNLKDDDEVISFLALLQHHGFATPLLDWTESPYIAAYFAFRKVDYQYPDVEAVSIYMFDQAGWEVALLNEWEIADIGEIRTIHETRPYVITKKPLAKWNPRLIPQQSAFMITNIPDIEGHIHKKEQETGETFLYKWAFDVHDKPTIMQDLRLMGITEMTMFPTIDGVCRFLDEKLFAPEKIGKTQMELMEEGWAEEAAKALAEDNALAALES